MLISDEDGRPLVHVDDAGVAHGAGQRVTVTVTVHRDDEDLDCHFLVCPDSFCPECFMPQLGQPGSTLAHEEP